MGEVEGESGRYREVGVDVEEEEITMSGEEESEDDARQREMDWFQSSFQLPLTDL